MKNSFFKGGIPISVSLEENLEAENIQPKITQDKKRLLIISMLAVVVATCISFIAKLLVYLINFCTNLSFYGRISIAHASPAHNSLGLFVIVIPAIGGIVIG